MAERKPWSEEEDRLLKFVFESSKLTKWSAIARRLAEEFGVKGRNGKHCKERYISLYLAIPRISTHLSRRRTGVVRRSSACSSCTTSWATNGR